MALVYRYVLADRRASHNNRITHNRTFFDRNARSDHRIMYFTVNLGTVSDDTFIHFCIC